ncbi:MAG: hypothetical protein JNM34_00195 [Chthonomonadaceae bacterium]|nr:hypothetical protein [Chthonomonadaceae bacterium]
MVLTSAVLETSADFPSSLGSFAALPSNIAAIEAALRFAHGTLPFVAITGPCGWGKTHLLSTVETVLSKSDAKPLSLTALQWSRSARPSSSSSPLIIDEAQELLSHPRSRHVWRQCLDVRKRTGRPTLVAWTSEGADHRTRSLLGLGPGWELAELQCPGLDEKELLVMRIAAELGVELSDLVVKVVARHVYGNGRSVRGALQRLKLVKKDWTSDLDVIPACGVLSPYLLGHDGWDPRDHVHDAVLSCTAGDSISLPLSCHLMLVEMGLPEREVAEFVKLPPGKAYQYSRSITDLKGDKRVGNLLDSCKIAILSGFQEA